MISVNFLVSRVLKQLNASFLHIRLLNFIFIIFKIILLQLFNLWKAFGRKKCLFWRTIHQLSFFKWLWSSSFIHLKNKTIWMHWLLKDRFSLQFLWLEDLWLKWGWSLNNLSAIKVLWTVWWIELALMRRRKRIFWWLFFRSLAFYLTECFGQLMSHLVLFSNYLTNNYI